jgi:hypothetical protein
MENLYPSLSERDYRRDFFQLAIRFLPEAEDLPTQKQQSFIHKHICSLPDEQKLALLQLEIQSYFDEYISKAHRQIRGSYPKKFSFIYTPYFKGESVISSHKEFETFFLAYLRLIDNDSIQHKYENYIVFSKYDLSIQDLQDILEVEHYILKQKLENLYKSYQQDVAFIFQHIAEMHDSFGESRYEMSYFGLNFPLQWSDGEPNIKAKTNLPIQINELNLMGKFVPDLKKRISEFQEALAQHQAKAQLAIAEHDLQNVIENYQAHNKIKQSVHMNIEIQCAVGKLKMELNSRIYWKKFRVFPVFAIGIIVELWRNGYLLGSISLGIFALLLTLWLFWKTLR